VAKDILAKAAAKKVKLLLPERPGHGCEAFKADAAHEVETLQTS
jgi:hypothetical protein